MNNFDKNKLTKKHDSKWGSEKEKGHMKLETKIKDFEEVWIRRA